jgi:hypothetical protein
LHEFGSGVAGVPGWVAGEEVEPSKRMPDGWWKARIREPLHRGNLVPEAKVEQRETMSVRAAVKVVVVAVANMFAGCVAEDETLSENAVKALEEVIQKAQAVANSDKLAFVVMELTICRWRCRVAEDDLQVVVSNCFQRTCFCVVVGPMRLYTAVDVGLQMEEGAEGDLQV